MLSDKEMSLIINDLLEHNNKIIKTEKLQNLIPLLDQDYNLMLFLTIEMKQELILKGVVISEKGVNLIPLHLYPLSLVILGLDPNIKEAILKYISSYQNVLKFDSK